MSQDSIFRIGTRDSILARLQTDLALKKLTENFPDLQFEVIACKTKGDKILNAPLSELGGRGVFVKELEEALLAGTVDLVVHSLKDLPTELPDGLCLAATFDRIDPRDVLVSKDGTDFRSLKPGSRVATSSRRRAAQLAAMRQDLQFVDIRGNIQTRMRKLDEGQCDAMVLAAAGLLRLNMRDRISQFFEPSESTPAVGQGALAIECRKHDKRVLEVLATLNDADTAACIGAERAFLQKLGGGCSVPVGALAKINAANEVEIEVCVAALNGSKVYKGTASGAKASVVKLGEDLANKLIKEGAGAIIEALLNSSIGVVSPP
jgi:hydroxymethylbilane synthase